MSSSGCIWGLMINETYRSFVVEIFERLLNGLFFFDCYREATAYFGGRIVGKMLQ